MLNRRDELKAYFDRQWPLLKVHYPTEIHGDVVVCSCNLGAKCDERDKGKHPAEPRGVHDARPRSNPDVFRSYNIGVACGGGFVVVDEDPRNGSEATMAALVAKHGPLPQTWTVVTGGGGRHRYFAVDGEQASGNRLKERGVELKGLGSYVLCPTSLHRSGRRYEWDVAPEDCELAPLPAWVLEELMPKQEPTTGKKTESPAAGELNRDELLSALNALDPSMGEAEWWKVGAACHAAGLAFEDWDRWSSGCPEKYSRAACEKRWKRYGEKPSGVSGLTLFKLAYAAGWKPPEAPRWEIEGGKEEAPAEVQGPSDSGESDESSTEEEVSFPPGIAGSLAEEILAAALFKHKRFAVASALSILGACCQGGYRSPNGQGVLGSYTFLVTESGGGKGDFVSPVVSTLRSAQKMLVLGDPASGQALRSELNRCPSRAILLDEAMKWLGKLMNAKNEAAQILQGDYLTSWAGGTLMSITTKEKASSSPEVESPTLTILGAGPTASFRGLLRQGRMLAEDGFLSRLDFVAGSAEEPTTFLKRPPFKASTPLLVRLQRIAKPTTDTKAISLPRNGEKSGDVAPMIRFEKKVEVRWSQEVAAAWDAFARDCYRKAHSCGLPFVWSRTAEKALRTASLLAIADEPDEPTISLEALEWAITWQQRLAQELERECRDHLDKSDEEMARAAVLHALKQEGGRIGRERIAKHCRAWAKLDERIKTAALEGLSRDGLVTLGGGQRGRTMVEWTPLARTGTKANVHR